MNMQSFFLTSALIVLCHISTTVYGNQGTYDAETYDVSARRSANSYRQSRWKSIQRHRYSDDEDDASGSGSGDYYRPYRGNVPGDVEATNDDTDIYIETQSKPSVVVDGAPKGQGPAPQQPATYGGNSATSLATSLVTIATCVALSYRAAYGVFWTEG